MNVAVSNPRVVALLGFAVAALVGLLVARPLIFSGDEATETTPPAAAPSAPSRSTPPGARASRQRATRIQVAPGLPAALARRLRYETVVVVSAYSDKAPSDRRALAAARAGAREVDAGFVALNVLNERKAREFAIFAGVGETPTILVVRRPGRVVKRIDGFVDSAIVAQAAHNAGAGRNRPK
jgi:hypothetical protein